MTRILLIIALAGGVSRAGLVDVELDTYTDNDNSETITAGDVLHIRIVSSVLVSVIDFSLEVSGPGTLTEAAGGIQHHNGFIVWLVPDPLIVKNQIEQLGGGALPPYIPPAELIWNLDVVCDAGGTITIDLKLRDESFYKNNDDDATFSTFTEGDLGGLEIPVEVAFDLTLDVVGEGGTASPPEGTYNAGTEVTVTANADPGYRVNRWTGTDNNLLRLNTNTVTMTKHKKVTVRFEEIPADLIKRTHFKAGKSRETQADRFVIVGSLSAGQADLLSADQVEIQLKG
ncbi:MAG: hypothetical protein IID32_10705, partial [Planctomycetes bacterium]|nr:hypothetical protein [Planctomycetota bacterium]